MASISQNSSLRDFQNFTEEVYGFNNDRFFSQRDMLTNIQRFTMRGLKGIRKGDKEKTCLNLVIALSWFSSFMNRLHIDIEDEVWQRFPGKCTYCDSSPCACKEQRSLERRNITGNESDRPRTLSELQTMFERIYPASQRTLEKAGIHLAEELGELAESILAFGGNKRSDDKFKEVKLEAADLISCFIGVFNSLHTNLSEMLTKQFHNNCNACHQAPCTCTFEYIMNYHS